jgi:peptidylprolyl isomerase
LAIIVALVAGGDDDTSNVAASASTTTSASAEGPVGGKLCVAPSGEAPAGAPEVAVKEGPPPTELVIEDLKVGEGSEVAPGSTVTVNYIGVACSTGEIFDSSYSRNEPATFPLTQVIPGWTDGIPGMKVGGQRLLGVPPDLAYGPQGQPPVIGPNETLWFVVEVLDTQPA